MKAGIGPEIVRWCVRNVIVCCDGTGNEIGENISNVLKLYRVLRKTEKTVPRQVVFYDPGVGTLARPDPWTKFRQDTQAVFGLATGYGLDENVLRAYRFLVRNYQDGDEIFLFGFSRGAYTVRVLAGFIHKVGLLAHQQLNLADAALAAYKQTSSACSEQEGHGSCSTLEEADDEVRGVPSSRDDSASQFARIVSSRWPTIRFLWVWDTVASIIVPRSDRFYVPSLQKLPFTQTNPSVQTFRQAASIDERRRMFRLEPWKEQEVFMRNRFSRVNNSTPQDTLQVWFSGVHADIGGGYPEAESGLSKFPLIWMIEEAVQCGMTISGQSMNQLAWGIQRQGSPFSYVAPDCKREPHQSMTALWRALEFIPKSNKFKEWVHRRSWLGFYVPNGEPRAIPDDAHVHQSVFDRMDAVPAYRPINLPSRWRVVPDSYRPDAER